MQTAAIVYRHGELEACEQDDLWTVRLANLEARARYLDLALAEFVGDSLEAHRAAAKLLAEMPEVVQHQEAADPQPAAPPREKHDHRRWQRIAKPFQLGLNALIFAVVAGTAFMLTTWLSALR